LEAGLNEDSQVSFGSRRSLLSLWDIMQTFFGKQMMLDLLNLEVECTKIRMTMKDPTLADQREKARKQATVIVESIQQHLANHPFPDSLKEYAQRTRNDLPNTEYDNFTMLDRIHQLGELILSELDSHLFLWIPSGDRTLYEAPLGTYTADALERFSLARPDIASCCRCIALGEWNASVFHAMGIAEHGLRYFAKKVKVHTPAELSNWGKIIDQIEAAIKAVEQKKKPTRAAELRKRDQLLQRYSEAASNFFSIKNAWRNHVAHNRATYTQGAARLIAINVRELLCTMAEWDKPKKPIAPSASLALPSATPISSLPQLDV
jgi:hypothetical protein